METEQTYHITDSGKIIELEDITPEIQDGQIAVLVSPGYGAGWSTWNCKEIAVDSKIVDLYDKYRPPLNTDELYELQIELQKIGYRNIYLGGYNDVRKVWMGLGTGFTISEDDGYETIDMLWL